MATQVKKVLAGPLTANPEADAGVAFVAADGTVLGSIRLADIPAEMRDRLALHGISQKVGDSYAGAAEADNPGAYVADAIKETLKQISENAWRVTQAGGFRVSLLARALARAAGQTPEAAQAVIDHNSQLDDDGKPSDEGKAWLKELRADEAIKSAVAAIKLEDAEKAKAKLKEQAAKSGDASKLAGLFAS